MNVLVTGGAGFIGSRTCDALVAGGHCVTVLDDLSTGYADNLSPKARLVEGSILDDAALKDAVAGQDGVVHLAGFTSVPDSFTTHQACFEMNVDGTLGVLEAAADAGVERIVFASSSAVYSDTDTNIKHETDCPMPGSPYAVSKLEGEHLLAHFDRRYDVRCVAFRYFNVYGPRQRVDSDYAAAVPNFADQALNGQTLTVYGDGSQTRDFVFVGDVARANVAALTVNRSGVYNVGTGEATRILDLAREISRLCGADPEAIRFEPLRPGDALSSEGDIGAVDSDLGWSPDVTLSAGLAQTVDWWREEIDAGVAGD